ncbi:protein of unknown function [Microbulbifer donghaiensis]|uniref:3-keto-alpha-glucoside-1,2-lyase/3-keto-2-hydroxy-glucal hydratase domain-containing protein n=1 Tax=Microbulbifer donghaiensis TaxID=494016 RepID=A0A1M5I4Y2_9GAMM|nr:DUF1080 domain-containing protein [Microbulbifer donghaiensis]SHG23000.1 protein of unknown function [Microbulbifer donghaiensis]
MTVPHLARAPILSALLALTAYASSSRPEDTEVWHPEPSIVTPGEAVEPPSDAIVLIGQDASLERWQSAGGGPARWHYADGVLTVVPGSGDILTRGDYGSVQLHLEWRSPPEPEQSGQDKGNSGLFFQSRYELQILDSYQNRTYANGQAGSIYKQHLPLVNAMRPTGQWQTYDAVYRAPAFDAAGKLLSPAHITVLHNGVLIQDHVEIQGETLYVGKPDYRPHGKAPIKLQDHSNPVSFRNMWLRELDETDR